MQGQAHTYLQVVTKIIPRPKLVRMLRCMLRLFKMGFDRIIVYPGLEDYLKTSSRDSRGGVSSAACSRRRFLAGLGLCSQCCRVAWRPPAAQSCPIDDVTMRGMPGIQALVRQLRSIRPLLAATSISGLPAGPPAAVLLKRRSSGGALMPLWSDSGSCSSAQTGAWSDPPKSAHMPAPVNCSSNACFGSPCPSHRIQDVQSAPSMPAQGFRGP